MQNNLNGQSLSDFILRPGISLLILMFYLLAGLFVFTVGGPLIVSAVYGISMDSLQQLMIAPEQFENGRSALFIIQSVSSGGLFILVPLIFIRFTLDMNVGNFFTLPSVAFRPMAMTIVIMFCFMIANSIVIEWNQNMVFPSFLNDFAEWAKSKEDQLEVLTVYLTTFDSFTQFLVGLMVIAVLPAIGEELLFRGLFQNLFQGIFRNPHVAIWITAVFFGAFHLQFYGVIPRILLGALFGYIYYWSGHLTLAMLGHFINNGITLLMIYLSQLQLIDFDPAGNDVSPPVYVVLIFFVAGSVLLFLFKNLFSEQNA